MASSNSPRYTLWMLSTVFMLNALDRNIVVVLAEAIKKDFALSDKAIGLLSGSAFAVLYMVVVIPIARVAEVRNRVWIIATALALWSAFTVMCGFTRSFVQLLLARVCVGIGEGGSSPASYSLIADHFPPQKRASAMAHYGLGAPVGSILGMVLGGLIAGAFGWRAAFMAVGLPGIIVAAIVLKTLKDPRHSGWGSGMLVVSTRPGLIAVLRVFIGKKSLLWLNLACLASAAMIYGEVAFLGSFLLRAHGSQLTELTAVVHQYSGVSLGHLGLVGIVLAVMLGLFGGIGTFLGGWFTDRATKENLSGYMTVPAAAFTMSPLLMSVGLAANNFLLALLFMALAVSFNMFVVGPSLAASQGLVPERMRATSAAVTVALNNGIGAGLGPLTVGLLSDHFAVATGPVEGLRTAMTAISILGLVAAIMFLMSRRTIVDEFEG